MLTYPLLALAVCTGLVVGAPYLGHVYQPYVDPYYYVTPSPVFYQNPYQNLYRFPYQHQQLISRPTVSTAHEEFYDVASPEDAYTDALTPEELPELNQFHSEDAEGRVLYGFHGHNQARMEARDSQGRVRGSYSYVDPNGQVVRMDYWDDGHGFQARGNHIPKANYDVPGFTPEVQAARDEHFKIYQQILLATIHAQNSNKVTEDDYPYVERPDGEVSSPISQDEDDDTVEVGFYPNRPEDIPSYPGPMRVPDEFQQPTYSFQDQDEEDLESIALDNPELQDPGRGAKSLVTNDNRQDGSNLQDNSQLSQDVKLEKSQDEMESKKETNEMAEMHDDKVMMEDKKSEVEGSEKEKNKKHSGFSYNFQYTLASPTKKQPVPNFEKVSSITASEPVPKDKKTSIHNIRPLPLRTVTSMNSNLMKTVHPPPAMHRMQMAPHQSILQPPMVIKTFPSPLQPNHNNQVPSPGKPLPMMARLNSETKL